jgi:hypothetical protein
MQLEEKITRLRALADHLEGGSTTVLTLEDRTMAAREGMELDSGETRVYLDGNVNLKSALKAKVQEAIRKLSRGL